MSKYLQSIKKDFWARVFEAEQRYIVEEVRGLEDILSVGCGPAVIEGWLADRGFKVTGLDISQEVLGRSQEGVRTVVGSAEAMDFADSSFGGVVYIASLQFIEGYERALVETARVLRGGGKVLFLLLNPKSEFFRARFAKRDSYVSRIKHRDQDAIERAIGEYLIVEQTEYFLGIRGQDVFMSRNPELASLYVIKARKQDFDKGGSN